MAARNNTKQTDTITFGCMARNTENASNNFSTSPRHTNHGWNTHSKLPNHFWHNMSICIGQRSGWKVEKCWVYAKEARAFLANLERQVNKMPQLRRHLRMPLGLVQMQTKAKHEQQQRGTAISNPMPRQMCCKPADFYNNVEFLNTAFDVVSAFEC